MAKRNMTIVSEGIEKVLPVSAGGDSTDPGIAELVALSPLHQPSSPERLAVRRSWLKQLWRSANKLVKAGGSFATVGSPDLDAEITATWGPFDADTPYDEPFNGGHCPAWFGVKAPVLQAAGPLNSGNGADKALSSWGRQQCDVLHDVPGWEDLTVRSPDGSEFLKCSDNVSIPVGTRLGDLSEKNQARAIWSVWQTLPQRSGQKVAKVASFFGGSPLSTDKPLSSFSKGKVDQIRQLPGFSTCQANQLDDRALAREIDRLWGQFTGGNRLFAVALRLMHKG